MDTKPAQKKTTTGPKAPVNNPRENLMKHVKLVIEVLGFENNNVSNKMIELSTRYKKLVSRSDMKIEQQHALFRELFFTYRDEILSSGKIDKTTKEISISAAAWAVKKPVEIWFGEHSEKYRKNEYRLKISAAYTRAQQIRDSMDKKIARDIDNPNLAELEKGLYQYNFIEMLNYYLYLVISDALGVIHADYAAVKKLSEDFRAKTCLRDRPEDVEDEAGNAIGDAISKAAAVSGKGKVDGKKIGQAIDTLAGDDGLIGNITGIFEKAVKAREEGAATPGNSKGGAMSALLQELAPDIETTFEGLTQLIGGEEQED